MTDPYVKLAKQAIDTFIQEGRILTVPDGLPSEAYSRQAGAFVSIHNGPDLRGCIGTFLPTRKNLAAEIIDMAVAACSQDDRFAQIKPDELPSLNIEVSILAEPFPVSDQNSLDPEKFGVIVSTPDGRRGLLLPDLDGIDTVDDQISIAARKGGINPDREEFSLQAFTVEKHG